MEPRGCREVAWADVVDLEGTAVGAWHARWSIYCVGVLGVFGMVVMTGVAGAGAVDGCLPPALLRIAGSCTCSAACTALSMLVL